jgi:hypothetical protein
MSNRSRFGFRRMNRSLAAIAAEEGVTSANLLASFTQSPDPIYGNGSDGDLTFDGTSSVLSIVPVLSTYTLTRDIYAVNMIINSNVKVITNGYRVFVRNILSMNSGSILGFETGSSATGSISGGGAILSAVANSLGGSSATLTAIPPIAALGGTQYWYQAMNAVRGWAVSASMTTPTFLRGGAGGVAQAGGGVVIVAARYITASASCTIGAPATAPAGGGVVITISSDSSLPGNITANVSGHNPGTAIHIQVA